MTAKDHLDREAVVGKLRFRPEQVELSWRLANNVFRGGKGEMKVVVFPYGQVEHVELRKRWFRPAELELHIDDPALVSEVPGVEMGKMVLEIDKRSKEEVDRLRNLIDFKRSIFLLDEQTKRLRELKDS